MLADSAQVTNGKLYLLGGCFNQMTPTSPVALAGYVIVPWDETNRQHEMTIELFNADGVAVSVATPLGAQKFLITAQFEVGRPPGVPQGTDFQIPIAVQLPPLGLAAGRYEFKCNVKGNSESQKIPFDIVA